MSIYSTPIITAIIVLLIIGFFAAIPWVIHSYRKYGFLSIWTTIMIFSFIFYALAAYFLVILPLPESRNTCAMQSPDTKHFQLIPFYFIYEILTESYIVWSKPSTYINFFRHGSFLTAFLNVLILLPLGVYMRYFFNKTMTVKRMLFIGFSVSLFFETTQVTGLYGIYNCPYRLFDVNDLILNTTGAVVGFALAPLLLALIPSRAQVLEKSNRVFKERVVRPLPQLLAIIIDYIIVSLLWIIISFILKIDDPLIEPFFKMIGMLVLQLIMPFSMKGKTFGTLLFRFKLIQKSTSNKNWFLALLQRWFALMAPWFAFQLLNIVARFSTLDIDSTYYMFNVFVQLIILFLSFLIVFVLFIHVLIVILSKKDHAYYFDALTGIEAHYLKNDQ